MMNKKCVGCGIELQNTDKNSLGYVNSLDNDLCERCFKLLNYGEYKNVSLNNNDYNKILDLISNDDLVIYVASIMSLNLDFIDRFKNVVLVITKRDVMPVSVKDNKLINYVKDRYKNIEDVFIVSSFNNYNLDMFYNYLCKMNNYKKVYVVGYTNSGKSSLINKLIYNYTSNDSNIITSMYPSTTLDMVSIKLNDLTLIDTPGLINNRSIINFIDKKMLKKINNKTMIKPKTCQIKNNGSIICDNLFRIDYSCMDSNSMVFYMSNDLNIKFNSLKNDKFMEYPSKEYFVKGGTDLLIDGVGFIKFSHDINISIYINENVDVKFRDSLI